MKPKSILGVPLLVLALVGCAPGFSPGGDTVAWLRPGSSRAQMASDRRDCAIEATQRIPSALYTQYTPGTWSPGPIFCSFRHHFAYCEPLGGVGFPPTATTVDRNDEVREAYFERCLARRGYSLLPTKFCASPEDATTPGCVAPGR